VWMTFGSPWDRVMFERPVMLERFVMICLPTVRV